MRIKPVKLSDLNKTQNKVKLIKVKIKRLKTKQRYSGGLLHKELKQEKLRKIKDKALSLIHI